MSDLVMLGAKKGSYGKMRLWSLRGVFQLFAQMMHIVVLYENEYFHMSQTLPEKLMHPTGAEKITS